jgi:hypothetical protein
MSPEQIEELGSALAQCRKRGVVAALPVDLIGSDEEAEAVQAAAFEAYGDDPCGYSVQATTPLSQRLLGCHALLFGPLLEGRVRSSLWLAPIQRMVRRFRGRPCREPSQAVGW